MNFINQKTKKQKTLNFMRTSGWNWSAANAPRLFSKHLNDRIFKIKQYLNYVLMIINQNALRNPKETIRSAKTFMKNFTTRRQLAKLRVLTERQNLMKNLSFVSQKHLQKTSQNLKILTQIIHLQVMMALQQNFKCTVEMNQVLSFQIFMTPWGSLEL